MKIVTFALLFLIMWEIFRPPDTRSVVTSYVIIFMASVLASLHMLDGPMFLGFVWWFNSVLWTVTLQMKKKSIALDAKLNENLEDINRLTSETRRRTRQLRDFFKRFKEEWDEDFPEI